MRVLIKAKSNPVPKPGSPARYWTDIPVEVELTPQIARYIDRGELVIVSNVTDIRPMTAPQTNAVPLEEKKTIEPIKDVGFETIRRRRKTYTQATQKKDE